MVKKEISIIEKIGVIGEIMNSCTDSLGEMDCLAFEIAKVFHIGKAYLGDSLDVEDEGVVSIVLTYENFMQSSTWINLIKENEDARLLVRLATRKYNEEFSKLNSLESKVVKLIENALSKIPSKDDIGGLIEENKLSLDSLTEEQKKLLSQLVGGQN